MIKPAILILEDGTQFHGHSMGAEGIAVGEMVFNTSITGYQEILTDPSYYRQIITFTNPHIGNTGINYDDSESAFVYAKGIVIRDLSLNYSNFRGKESLSSYSKKQKIVAITDIDTRKLTRLLRTKGSQNGCIITGNNLNPYLALKKIKSFKGIQGLDLAKEVTTKFFYTWTQKSNQVVTDQLLPINDKINKILPYHIIVYDFGIKRNILRLLVDRNCSLTIVPATTSAIEVLKMIPDGIFLSNGPGDPAACHYAITSIKYFLTTDIPIFGICLGYQLLAIASGAKTIKMKFGHHGSNHPVKDLVNNKIMITTQNHSFTIDKVSLTDNLLITHKSLFDDSIQGIHRIDKPAFGFQGHPEGSPGPKDAEYLFDYFIKLVEKYRLINLATKVG
ncbi:Carbamoyl-phosphate synthase small chain [Candidatus Arsenophonus lipoptenae]|uniref:Carbamoyl phosphate synthase small chain n=1 Tax=Candidatus Arsenophonus lipoptenae TaxID=634113 RepID=A0A120HPU7_9GAMM|nr:glutamine-hydrolyzing carbamoyl-phosphate synthase small subunit [Candidatus Arsenophonus lipoptenae]AMA64843.1 Carbamoyl-phosphate synthase small chain [Candidatus Arsenophonus lipoptenae]